MEPIKMQNPIVEIDGDEMTRILWAMIKDELIRPFVDLNTEYYDLCLPNRDATDDQITLQAAEAIKRWHVGVKCATITPNLQRMEEYHLKKMWKSPNATIRAALDGTVFRAPILISKVKPVVSCWKKPITIARHAYGDIYKAVEYRVPGPGKAELVFTDESGKELSRQTIFDFKGPGVLQGMHNRDDSILSFARCCFTYALEVGQDVWFSTKDTISKDYDQTFKLLFQKVYDEEFAEKFAQAGLTYRYALIDDVAAKVIRSEGGMIWACKNYDGDVMSDLIAAASGSLPMMTSVLVSPDGNFEYEAAHGTITDHYRRHQKGEKLSSNPLATIAAWAGALKKRGELDGNAALVHFADCLNQAGLDVFEEGYLSEDLAMLCDPKELKEMPENSIGDVTWDDTCENSHAINVLGIPMVVMGAKNMVIAASHDGILVADKHQSSYIKDCLSHISDTSKYEERRWGTIKTIDNNDEDGTHSVTKRIKILAGKTMPYHTHAQHTETITVISGMGKLILEGTEVDLLAGSTVSIASGKKHSIKALGSDLRLIEVSLGVTCDDEQVLG